MPVFIGAFGYEMLDALLSTIFETITKLPPAST
jgi:hypothetical protein